MVGLRVRRGAAAGMAGRVRCAAASGWPRRAAAAPLDCFALNFPARPCPGFYLEFGAMDGNQWSNTKWLHDQAGWKGMLIEAEPGGRIACFGRRWAAPPGRHLRSPPPGPCHPPLPIRLPASQASTLRSPRTGGATSALGPPFATGSKPCTTSTRARLEVGGPGWRGLLADCVRLQRLPRLLPAG